jgi:sensor histidine kinase regulating citrate/malate metabolism
MKKRGQAHAELRRLLPLFACQLFSMALTHYILVTGYLHGGGLTWGPLAVTIGILLGNIMLIWYFDSIAAMYEYKQLAATVEASLEQQVRFYGLLEQRQQETNAHWHDIEKHVAVMRDLKHMGALEIADEYAADLEGALDAMPSVVSTPHPIVSAVLTYGLERAREAGITVKMDVRISGDISAKPVDLCIVLGNIFDNAVEACGALPDGTEKIIEVSIRQMNGALLIEMNNPYCPDDGERKRGGRLGIGLKNVEHVAGKYGGNVKVSSSDEAFTVSVLLP